MDDKAQLTEAVRSIESVIKEQRQYYRQRKKEIQKELKSLPAKGSVHRRKIKRWVYYYLVYRDDTGKLHSDYIGKEEPVELKKQVARRQFLRKELRKIEEAMYVLGLARRKKLGTQAKRFAVLSRDNFTCQYCGRSVQKHKVVLVVDHIVPKKQGGTDDITNLISACEDCNIGKHKYMLKESI
jgi:5-methylcytosine-specific restriction endonuclease McrA